MKRTPLALAAGLFATTLFAASAAAAPTPPATETLTTRVRYADLDLSREADVGRLYVRLRNAATMVCLNPQAGFARVDEACRIRALDEAVHAVHSDSLSTLHGRVARTGHAAVRAD